MSLSECQIQCVEKKKGTIIQRLCLMQEKEAAVSLITKNSNSCVF